MLEHKKKHDGGFHQIIQTDVSLSSVINSQLI